MNMSKKINEAHKKLIEAYKVLHQTHILLHDRMRKSLPRRYGAEQMTEREIPTRGNLTESDWQHILWAWNRYSQYQCDVEWKAQVMVGDAVDNLREYLYDNGYQLYDEEDQWTDEPREFVNERFNQYLQEFWPSKAKHEEE
jgi:hypothetical protein